MASSQTTSTVPGPGLSVPETPPREISIEVERLSKSYLIPTQKLDTLKERAVRPFERATHRRLQALDAVSFAVEQGEFFGIVGRNGSGKSTLLKLLASIYRADAGRIRIAGRVVPFIELGVGFNVELSARDNVVLNGVMMGLTPREARYRFSEVIEFAELEEFSELKLKNYSSGMMVRLGFALMTQVEADVLLIDEVLAVGDAAFQQKSFDAFSRLHREGRTIVLVTHDMHTVQGHCDRAILLEEGRIAQIGDAGDVARRYLELNFEHRRAENEFEDVRFRGGGDVAEFLDVRIVDESGATVTSIEARQPIRIEIEIEAKTRIERPMFGFQILDGDGLQIFSPDPWGLDTPLTDRALEPGQRVHLRAEVANPLASGHYYVNCALGRLATEMEMMAFRKHAADFIVYGVKPFGGLVRLDYETSVEVEDER
jgi:ABC-type polysaccharide/polyol phosphate transport system ATPase subunit